MELQAPSSKVFVGGDDDSLQSDLESVTGASCGQEVSSVTLEGTTELYHLLEESEWEAAGQRCQSHPEEAEHWLVRWGDDEDDLRWKLLPLHAAIIFQCPVPDLIVTLCDTFRDACREPDDQGMLPLHLAFRNLRIPTQYGTDAAANNNDIDDTDGVEERIICILLDAYPEAMFVKDNRNRIPLIHAGKDSCDTPTSRSLLQQTHPMVMNYYMQWEQTLTATTTTETQPSKDDEWDGPLNSSFEITTHNSTTEQRVITPEQDTSTTTRAQLEERVKVLQLETESQQREFEWEQRVEELELTLQKSQSENNLLHAVMEDMKVQQDTLILQLDTLMEGQELLGKLVTCHKTEQLANEKVRDKLLRALLEQEEEDHTATLRHQDQIMSLMDNLRDKTETVLKSVTTDLTIATLEEEEQQDESPDQVVGDNDDDDSQHQYKTEPRLSDRQKMDDISCITDLSE